MKKKIKLYSYIRLFCITLLLVVSIFTIANINKTNKISFADCESSQFLEVVGVAKVEVDADAAELNFCLKSISDSYEQSLLNVNENYNKIKEEILNIDANSKIYINHSSSQLMRENNLNYYHHSISYSVKTKKLDEIKNIIDVSINNGANVYYRVNYLLEDDSDIYAECLNKAKTNAENKASKIFSNCNLKGLKEINVYSYSLGEESPTIVVEASIKAIYVVCNDESTQVLNDDSMSNSQREEVLYI